MDKADVGMTARVFDIKYKLFIMGTLFLLGALIYSNSFHGSFHFDDTVLIIGNPAIKNILDLRAIWNSWPTRFMTSLSVVFNYRLSGLNVFGYHLFNFSVHICNAIMVWWFMLLTFSAPAMHGKKITKHANLIAFFAGLVFMAHPIQTQAVNYIIQRAASLATLFYLTCLALYADSRLLQKNGKNPEASRLSYFGSLIAAVMAMFTKEIAITLPLAVLLYDYCFFRTGKRFDWKYPAFLFATILVIPLTMLMTGSIDFIEMRRTVEPPPGISPWHYLCTQLRVVVTYIRLLFLPINQNFIYDYKIAHGLLEWPVLASIIFLASILAAAVRIFSKYRLVSFGIFWFFLTLLPESSIIPIKDVIFEHRLYLPMVGFSFFIVGAIYYLFENENLRSMIVVLLIITLCYGVLSHRRNLVWKDEFTLWNDTVQKSPRLAMPYFGRGAAYAAQGNLSQAISDYTRAIEIIPGLAVAYHNRGNVYFQQGRLPQAISDYTRAIEIDPSLADTYRNRGVAYYRTREHDKARADIYKAVELGKI